MTIDTLGYKPVSARPELLDIRTFLILALVCGAIGVAIWMSFAKIDAATSANGELRVESHRKTVKVLEPGVVHQLLVAEGMHVVEGQPLIELDPTRASASYDIFQQRYYVAQVQLARAEAEAAGRETIRFPNELLKQMDNPDIRAAMANETELFLTRRAALDAKRDIIKNRIGQLHTRISSTDQQIAAAKEQIALIADELTSVEFLLGKNLIQKSRYLAVKRSHVDLKAKLSELRGTRAELDQTVGATQIELLDLDEQARKEALGQIGDLNALLLELEKQIGSAANSVDLFTVRAPHDGTVVKLQVFNEGAIVFAGEPLMDIVPDNDRLIVEAEISPNDINNVEPGMKAKVRLSALNARVTPLLSGYVSLVSADLVSPADAKSKYYGASVVLDEDSLKLLGDDVTLQPGMQAKVMIVKGERTILDYLLTPLTLAAESAMREP